MLLSPDDSHSPLQAQTLQPTTITHMSSGRVTESFRLRPSYPFSFSLTLKLIFA